MLKPIFVSLFMLNASAFAQWDNTDEILINADNNEPLALLAKPLLPESPVTAITTFGHYLGMESQTKASSPITVYYSVENCQGYAYIIPPYDLYSDVRNVVGTTKEEYYTVNPFSVVEVNDLTPQAISYQSKRDGSTHKCANEVKSINGVRATTNSLNAYPSLDIDGYGSLQYNNTLNYATTTRSEDYLISSTPRKLTVVISKNGTINHAINESGIPLYLQDMSVTHNQDNAYDLHLPTAVLGENHEYFRVHTQCSINEPNNVIAADYTLGCYKVNNESIIRIMTNNIKNVSNEAMLSVNIQW